MKRLTNIALGLLIAFALSPAEAQAGNCHNNGNGGGVGNCLVLRAAAAEIPALVSSYGLTVVGPLTASDPDAVVAEGPSTIPIEDTVALLAQDPDVIDVEEVTLASLSESDPGAIIDLTQLATVDATLSGAYQGSESSYYSTTIWSGYMEQPAVALMKLPLARDAAVPESYGTGIVAIIDTGVDPDHPLLQGALVPGYDFILDQAGIPSEWDALDPATATQTKYDMESYADQSLVTVLEGGGDTALVGDSTETIVDQSLVTVLESEPLPVAFGHGTMVAGLVRLVAPGAQIMPIRVFAGDGTASTADVVQAIYFAIDNGATVINMSFSMTETSGELSRAISKAKQAGIVCVSSAGNQGSQGLTYPAAEGYVIGVASTDTQDRLSAFSNHGSSLVTVAAPGEAMISLYPGGLYAGGWGTSFSSALVAGAVTLLNDGTVSGFNTINFNQAEPAIQDSADAPDPSTPTGAVGSGRLDCQGAIVWGLYCNSPNVGICDPANDVGN